MMTLTKKMSLRPESSLNAWLGQSGVSWESQAFEIPSLGFLRLRGELLNFPNLILVPFSPSLEITIPGAP